MRLELSRKAARDLDEIGEYSVRVFGADRAILYLDVIEQALRQVVAHPQIGLSRADLGPRVRSYPAGEHRIFYEAREDAAFVIRLLHKAMDVERNL